MNMETFEARLEEYRQAIETDRGGKFTTVRDALCGELKDEFLAEFRKKCDERHGEVDFDMLGYLRMLYLGERSVAAGTLSSESFLKIRDAVEGSLQDFPFWPHVEALVPNCDKIVFWSENHILMFLSSAHLFQQWVAKRNAAGASPPLTTRANRLEEKLLRIYLMAHADFDGVYECNSHVYLPYSISALGNLYDFSEDATVRELAGEVLDHIVRQLMICTNDRGYGTLAAAARAFPRTRQRPYDHNFNQLARLFYGSSPNPFQPTHLTNCLLTTAWRPSEEVFRAVEFTGFTRIKVSHDFSAIRDLYKGLRNGVDMHFQPPEALADLELVPLYWSAGLVTHPDFAKESNEYIKTRKLTNNTHLKLLSFLPSSLQNLLLNDFSVLSKGQLYAGISLNVYKEAEGLALTSFELFSGGAASFQQLPWMANVDGVPVWSQSGKGAEGVAGFGITNTHNPFISQSGSVMVAACCTPKSLRHSITGSLLSSMVRVFWPETFFSETLMPTTSGKTCDKGVWWVGRRNSCFIGVMCTQETIVDRSKSKDAVYQLSKESQKINLPRRVCEEFNHAWIVVVGTTKLFETLDEFLARCQMITYRENSTRSTVFSSPKHYYIAVSDPREGGNIEIQT